MACDVSPVAIFLLFLGRTLHWGEVNCANFFLPQSLTQLQVYFLFIHETKPSISVKKDQEVNKISNRALTVGMICKIFTIFFLFVSSLGNFQVSKYIYILNLYLRGAIIKMKTYEILQKGGGGLAKSEILLQKGGLVLSKKILS